MRTCIIDVGTKSIKNIIFEGKKVVTFDKASTINLGTELLNSNRLENSKIENALNHIKSLIEKNNVDKTIIIGTDALRKAENAADFIDSLKQDTGIDIRIISHDEEAELLGEAYKGLIDEDFAVIDVGGGSTEVVVFKDNKMHTIMIPFGVNKIHHDFLEKDYENDNFNNQETWDKVETFLDAEIDKAFSNNPGLEVNHYFIDGTQEFMLKNRELLETDFKDADIEDHPVKMDMEVYKKHVSMLRKVGVKRLAENFSQDPGYADNFALGQTIYYTVAKKLGIKNVYPSKLQYTHGLLK